MTGLWNNNEAAAFLNVSPLTLRGWVSRRAIPFVKMGRRVLFDPEDLRAFVEARKVKARTTE